MRGGKHLLAEDGPLQKRVIAGLRKHWSPLVPLGEEKDAISVRRAYAKALRSVPKELAKTLTYDQGKEMSQHRRSPSIRVSRSISPIQ